MDNILLERMKLLMSYDTKKTLLENKSDIFEAPTRQTIKALESFGITRDTINKAMYSTIKQLENEFNIAKKAGKNTDEILEKLIARNVIQVDPNKVIAPEEMSRIANEVVNKYRPTTGTGKELGKVTKASNKEAPLISKTGEAPKGKNTNKQSTTNPKTGESSTGKNTDKQSTTNPKTGESSTGKNTNKQSTTNPKTGEGLGAKKEVTPIKDTTRLIDAPKPEAIKNVEDTAKKATDPTLKETLNKNKSLLQKMNDLTFQKFKNISKKLNKKWLLALGLLGAGGAGLYYLWSTFFDGDDDNLYLFDDCIIDLLNSNPDNKVLVNSAGSPVVSVKYSGIKAYDNNGGLQFWTNKRVMIINTKKMGTWSCNSSADSDLPINNIKIVWDNKKTTTKPKRKWRKNNEFPLYFGDEGSKIGDMQSALGITVDNRFGLQTLSAIRRRLRDLGVPYGDEAITKELYDLIINGQSKTETTPEPKTPVVNALHLKPSSEVKPLDTSNLAKGFEDKVKNLTFNPSYTPIGAEPKKTEEPVKPEDNSNIIKIKTSPNGAEKIKYFRPEDSEGESNIRKIKRSPNGTEKIKYFRP